MSAVPTLRRGLRDGAAVAGLLFAAYLFGFVAPSVGTFGFDARAYWAVDLASPYELGAGALGAFTYTPVAARVFALAGGLAWPDFLWLWSAVLLATLIWLGWRRTLLVLALPPVAIELYHGNVNLLIAAAVALGFRYPLAWALPLLTKVTPGVGLVWFAVRREWRSLAVALVATGGLVALSVVVDGRLWSDWLAAVLRTNETPVDQPHLPVPLWLRLPLAALLVGWGARSGRRWTVPAGTVLAMPILWTASVSVLAALAALDRPALRERERPA
jgi:hypothetical protein